MNSFFYTPGKWKTGTLEITGIRERKESLTIPSRINGYPVSSIARSAFRGQQQIRHITFEEGIEVIDTDAFLDCHFLETVTFPRTISFIASHAFQRCVRLKAIHLTSPRLSIGSGAFEDCNSLETASLNNAYHIGNRAFFNCRRLKFFSFSETPRFVGSECFSHSQVPEISENGFIHIQGKILLGYQGKSSCIRIPDGFAAAASESFSHMDFISHVHFPPSMKTLGEKAFSKCFSLKTITGCEKTEEIFGHAFEECTSLKAVPSCPSLTYLGEYAFAGCTSLKQIHVPRSLKEIRTGAFKDCSRAEHLSLPDTLVSIGSSAFFGCESLKSFTLPDSLQELEDNAFGKCDSLQHIMVRHWNFPQGFPGTDLHVNLVFLNEAGRILTVLFYSNDWRRFLQGGRARMLLSLFDAPEKIDFREYDSCLPLLNHKEDQAHFVLNRLLYPLRLSAEKKSEYENFVLEHPENILNEIIKYDMEDAALLLCKNGLLTANSMELAISMTSCRNKTALLLIFLNHKQNTSSEASPDHLFEL